MAREKVYVVDENDNVIAEKWRDETSPSDRIRIVAVWVENGNNEVLISQRSKNKRLHPGLWGPSAAGGVTVGEDYITAAKKELSEEIGLDVDIEGLSLEYEDKFTYGSNALDDGLRMLSVFTIKTEWTLEKFTFQEDEVDAIKWISKKELSEDLKINPQLYLPQKNTWSRYF